MEKYEIISNNSKRKKYVHVYNVESTDFGTLPSLIQYKIILPIAKLNLDISEEFSKKRNEIKYRFKNISENIELKTNRIGNDETFEYSTYLQIPAINMPGEDVKLDEMLFKCFHGTIKGTPTDAIIYYTDLFSYLNNFKKIEIRKFCNPLLSMSKDMMLEEILKMQKKGIITLIKTPEYEYVLEEGLFGYKNPEGN